jgi:hypothetical protein
MSHKIKVRMVPGTYGSQVEIDGKPMEGLTNIEVGHEVGSASWLRLSFVGFDLDLEGDVGNVVMPDALPDALPGAE